MGLQFTVTKKYNFAIFITVALIIVFGNGCGSHTDKPNIIILLLDCVRADHVGCYGYSRDTTPHIDALVAQGIKFNKAISQAPWTLPSVVSLFSGHYPHRHGAGLTAQEGRYLERDQKHVKMPGLNTPLLSELLRQNGYQTFGFSTNNYTSDKILGKRGFDEFTFELKAPAAKLVEYGISKIESAKNSAIPFFLFLHFMDAHEPLQPPGKYFNYFSTSDGKKNTAIHERWEYQNPASQKGIEFENYREHKISLYDGAIRYMDDEIGRLIEYLKNSGQMSDTLVVVVADHGEEFWERGGIGHGFTMYQEQLWVPLIFNNIHSTGEITSFLKQEPGEVPDAVPLMDIFPTILERTGVQNIPDCDGRSLLPLLNRWRVPLFSSSTKSTPRSIFSESPAYGNLRISLTKFPYKCIYTYKGKNVLFNLEDDPQERENLFEDYPQIAFGMLNKILATSKEVPGQIEKIPLSKDDLDALKGLGYIE